MKIIIFQIIIRKNLIKYVKNKNIQFEDINNNNFIIIDENYDVIRNIIY